MNTFKTKRIVAAFACLLLFAGCEDHKIIPQTELPPEVTSYISNNFKHTTIAQATQEREGLGKTYDIVLADGISLEFNGKNEITDIKSNRAIPDGVMPQKIRAYVNQTYPGSTIKQWQNEGNGQQVKLDNGIELKFNKAGDFQRIDQ